MITKLDVSKNEKLQNLYCDNNQLSSLNVENLELLEWLFAYNNQLTELKLGNHPNIDFLSVHHNKLKELNVTKLPKLATLYADFNELQKLDVSQNKTLSSLNISDNQFSNIDVKGLGELRSLSIHGNKFTQLDLTGCTQISQLYLYDNELPSSVFQQILSAVPTGKADRPSNLYALNTSNKEEKNEIKKAEVDGFLAKNWMVFDFKNGLNKGQNPFAGSDVALDEVRLGGEDFYFNAEQGTLVCHAEVLLYSLYDAAGHSLVETPNLTDLNQLLSTMRGHYIALAKTASGKQLVCKISH